jgi:hypothetical protein
MLLLALLALVVRVAVPPGFMADPTGGAGLVLCVSHGPVSLDDGQPLAPEKANPDTPCAFVGHASAAAAPETALPVLTILWRDAPAPQSAQPDQTPGRGLAAPPPPAIGPPRLI